MGQSRVRKLALVEGAKTGQPVTLTPAPKVAARLAGLFYQLEGAKAVAQAALNTAQALDRGYREALIGYVEENDLDVGKNDLVNHDARKGVITYTAGGAPGGKIPDPPSGTEPQDEPAG
jgi:hypothetical protein